MAKIWNKEGDRVLQTARGAYAPYRICNRTGGTLYIWTDTSASMNANSFQQTKLSSGTSVDWRFEDWKKMREVRRRVNALCAFDGSDGGVFVKRTVPLQVLIHWVSASMPNHGNI